MDIIEKALRKKSSEVVKNAPLHTKRPAQNDQSLASDEVVVTAVASQTEILNDDTQPRSINSIDVDTKHLSDLGILVPDHENSVINEEFRRIKTPLLQNIKGKSAHPIRKANLIQVTSALQGEGKSFNAVNLAMSMAMELDFNVLLVDADVLKPSISNVLNIKTDKGLIDYLSGDVDNLSDVLLTTNIPKLTLLPAGIKHKLSVELFNSDVMLQLFDELSQRYSDRVVIIDSPPILQTNESSILAQNVGQIVFVIEQNTTAMIDVKNAISKLPSDAVIGLVINKSRSGKEDGYGYGYGYGAE